MKGLNHSASFAVSTSSKLSTSSLGRHRHRVVIYTCSIHRPNAVVVYTYPMLYTAQTQTQGCNIHRPNVVIFTGPML